MDLNQIALAVRDLEGCIAFYRRIGLRLIVQNAAYARFELPTGSATLSLFLSDEASPGATVLYFEVPDIDRRHRELVAEGVVFDTPPTDESWLWREAHFTDPAGNRLCLFHAGRNRRFPPWRIGHPDPPAPQS